MAPEPRSYMWGRTARRQRNVPVSVTSMTRPHCSSVMSVDEAVAAEAGVVHPHVDAAEIGHRAGHEPLHVVLDRHVAREGGRTCAELGFELVGRLAQPAFVERR